MNKLDALFDDKRVLCLCIAAWTTSVAVIFVCIMMDDNSPFLSFGPNDRTVLFGVKVDTWTKWACIAMYTFVATCIADFTSDSVGPFVTNTIQDHKNLYIPYSKATCVLIVQVFAVYAIVMNTIGLFVALSQIDFMMIRMCADLMVNYYTCYRFMRYKSVNPDLYEQYIRSHCVDAVRFNGDGDGSSYTSTAATPNVRSASPHLAQKSAPPYLAQKSAPPYLAQPCAQFRSASPRHVQVRPASPRHPQFRSASPHLAQPCASPVQIRRAASQSSRLPESDLIEGIERQSLVPLTHEAFELYAAADAHESGYEVHSPLRGEHDSAALLR